MRPAPHFSLRETTGAQVCHNLAKDRVVIGRAESCDLILADGTVSRRHAEIRRSKDSWSLQDLRSRHGTRLNGLPVRSEARLERGDEITVGSVALVFDILSETAPEAQRTRSRIEHVSDSTASVLLTGETGTGKEVVARLIHQRSPRAAGPFVVVNCPALAPGLTESELLRGEPGGDGRRRAHRPPGKGARRDALPR